MEFQEEAGITELQEEYEQYTEEEYEVETQEEPTEAKLLNVTEEELERLLSASNGNNYLGYNEIKGVEYQYYYSEKWQEIYAKCVIQDEIYELEEEIEYLDVIFPVSLEVVYLAKEVVTFLEIIKETHKNKAIKRNTIELLFCFIFYLP